MYFDGFNFYYSLVKGTPYRWTNLKLLMEQVLQPHNKLSSIKYFTAKVSGTASDPGKPTRQETYLRALDAYIPEFSTHFGNFMSHSKTMPLSSNRQQLVNVIHTEEKGSDVNLAVHLLNDAWLDNYECAVVVSNDSDLAEAIKLVRMQGKLIGVVTSQNRPTLSLRREANFYRRIKPSDLAKSALPETIPGTSITKPIRW